MTQDGPESKLHIDTDWKAEAQAEKERLAEEERRRATESDEADQPGQLPEASFRTLVSMLASQALMGLGTMVDPKTKGVVVDLEGSRLAIDLLDVLDQKTKGNLEAEEAEELGQLLSQLRQRFVEIQQAVMSSSAAGASPLGAPPLDAGPGPIITE